MNNVELHPNPPVMSVTREALEWLSLAQDALQIPNAASALVIGIELFIERVGHQYPQLVATLNPKNCDLCVVPDSNGDDFFSM